jgi:hypothetical protein
MEQVEFTLPEYFGQVGKEVRQDLLHAGGVVLLSVDQLIDVLGGAESVRPDLKLQGELKLVISQFKDLLKGIFLI